MIGKIGLVLVSAVVCATLAFAPARSQSSDPSPAAAPAVTVHMKDFAFDPSSASVTVGQTVAFRNDDNATHNVVASDEKIDSGDIGTGKSWSYTFTKAGTYEYVCTYHPWMKGKITVTNSK